MSHAKVELDGNLTKDPEYRNTPGGTTLAKCGVAVDRGHFDKTTNQWIANVGFYNLVAFGSVADKLNKLQKGWKIIGCGDLSFSAYQNANGETRTSVEIIISKIYYAAPPKGPGAPRSGNNHSAAPGATGQATADMVNQKMGDGAEFDDDDIPY